MKWITKLYEIDDKMYTYKIPIIRIIGSLLVIIGVSVFRFTRKIEGVLANAILTPIIIIFIIGAVLCLFTSLAQCIQVSYNRKMKK